MNVRLSGTMEEVYMEMDVIRKWNQMSAKREGKLFLLVGSRCKMPMR